VRPDAILSLCLCGEVCTQTKQRCHPSMDPQPEDTFSWFLRIQKELCASLEIVFPWSGEDCGNHVVLSCISREAEKWSFFFFLEKWSLMLGCSHVPSAVGPEKLFPHPGCQRSCSREDQTNF
jgi:hypothetical protein